MFEWDWGERERKFSDKDIQDMLNLREQGYTYSAIGKLYKRNRGQIFNLINKHRYIPEQIIPKGYISLEEYALDNYIPKSTVYDYVKRKNIDYVKVSNKIYIDKNMVWTNDKFISEEKLDNLYELYDAGLKSFRQLAKATGLCTKTISYYIKNR